MERIVPKRNKSVKFSPGTSEDGSEDEAGKHVSRIRKPARPQKPGHLSIQHGLSNAHLVLRRYAALDGFGAGEVPDDEHEILNSPKVAPAQPVDRCSLTFNLHCLHSYRLQYSMSIWQTALKQELPVSKCSHACTVEYVSLLWLPFSHSQILASKVHCTHNCSTCVPFFFTSSLFAACSPFSFCAAPFSHFCYVAIYTTWTCMTHPARTVATQQHSLYTVQLLLSDIPPTG